MERIRISIAFSSLIVLECIYSITSSTVQEDPVKENSPRTRTIYDAGRQQRSEIVESEENVFISLGERLRRGSYDDKQNEINDDTVADDDTANEPPKNSKQLGRGFYRAKPRRPRGPHPADDGQRGGYYQNQPAPPPPRRGDRREWSRGMGRSLNEMVAEKQETNTKGDEMRESEKNAAIMGLKRKWAISPKKNTTKSPAPVIMEGGIPCEIRDDPEDKEADIDKRWDKVNIFAVKEYSAEHIKLLNETLDIFREAAPCLPINLLREGRDERPEGSYLELDYEYTGPCYSYVGRTKSESQSLGLPPSCMTPELIAHEFMHALGFDHEQCRPDRDNFVEIYWHNFHPGEGYSGYEIKPEALAIGPYDFGSIMHFKPIGNTLGGPTMQSKTGEELGNTDGKLTELDKDKIRQLYCPKLQPGKNGPCNMKLAAIMEREKGMNITTKRARRKAKTKTSTNKPVTDPTGTNQLE